MIDSLDFLATYQAVYSVETPSGDILEYPVEMIVGVFLPFFAGVEDRYVDEDFFVDLLHGVTAEDGYGNDISDTIEVTIPEDLNIYYPQPGTYEIGLEFTHNVFIEGEESYINLDGDEFVFDGSFNLVSTDWDSQIIVYDDVTQLQATTMSWGSSGVIIEVAGDGTIIRTIDRHNWDLVDENGLNNPATAQGMFDTWLADLTLEPNGFIIIVGYKLTTEYTAAKTLAFGDPVSYNLTNKPELDYDIVTNATYTLTVDDTTDPLALIVNDNYMIEAGEYSSVQDAILANVVAFDTFDPVDDLAIYVSDNGGLMLNTVGVYTVEVTVEDMAGNSAVVEFDVEVVAAPIIMTETQIQALIDAAIAGQDVLTEAEIQAMLDDQTLTETEIQALIDAGVWTEAEIQALIDAGIWTEAAIQDLIDTAEEDDLTETDVQGLIDESLEGYQPLDTGCGNATGSIPSLGIVGVFALLGALVLVFRRQH